MNKESLLRKNALEAQIDSSSLEDVIDALSEICQEKAEHIRSNWGDYALALHWERAGNMLATLTIKLPVGIGGKTPGITK